MSSELESVKQFMRSVLQSSQDGVALDLLEHEYRSLVNESIPYRRLGFATLEAFIKSISDTARLVTINKETYVKHVDCESTAHIAELVRGQMRKKTIKPSKRPRPIHHFRYNNSAPHNRGRTAPRLTGFRNQPLMPMRQNSRQAMPNSMRLNARLDLNMNDMKSNNERELPRPKAIRNASESQNRTVNYNQSLSTPMTITFNSISSHSSNGRNNNVDNKYNEQTLSIQQIRAHLKQNVNSDSSNINKPSFRNLLLNYTNENNLQKPEYKSSGFQEKKSKKIVYVARVKVADRSIVSHNILYSPDEAEEEAAKIAYEELNKNKEIAKKKLTEDQSKTLSIIDKIVAILSENALQSWISSGLSEEYFKRYKEGLPSNWIDIVKDSRRLEVQELNFSNVSKILIQLPNPKLKKRDSICSTSSSPSPNPDDNISFFIEAHSTNVCETQIMPNSLPLPDSDTWDVIVTKLVDTREVYLRLVETSDEYSKLSSEMYSYYKANPKPVNQIIEGRIYVVCYEGTAFRVMAKSQNEKIVKCLFIDEGDIGYINESEMREIRSQFLQLPFQAFSCSLSGLDMYGSNKIATDKLMSLVESMDEPVFVCIPISRDEPISIKLFDTSSDDVDLDINLEIIQHMYSHAYDHLMTIAGSECQVCVISHIETGVIFVQIEGHYYQMFESLRDKVNQLCKDSNEISNIEQLNDELYKSPLSYYYVNYDGNYCRAIVSDVKDVNSIHVRYVDYGNEENVDLSKLRSLESHLDPLFAIPYLAVSVRLNCVIDWSDVMDLFDQQFKMDDLLTMRVVKPSNSVNSVAVVELLDNSMLISEKLVSAFKQLNPYKLENVNKILDANSISSVYQNDKTLSSKLVIDGSGDDVITNGKDIPSAVLPKVNPYPKDYDDFIDVMVLRVVSPYNFIVMPFINMQSDSEFGCLRRSMFEFYEREENRIDLPHLVIKKDMYAAGKVDANWLRIQIVSFCAENTVEVMALLVDYGNIRQIQLSDIQPLFSQFRSLPMQAISASLATVEPIDNDWDPSTCFQFRNMVENKPFVATVYKIERVNGEPILKISLCDTSGAEDAYVGKELVQKGLAKQLIPI